MVRRRYPRRNIIPQGRGPQGTWHSRHRRSSSRDPCPRYLPAGRGPRVKTAGPSHPSSPSPPHPTGGPRTAGLEPGAVHRSSRAQTYRSDTSTQAHPSRRRTGQRVALLARGSVRPSRYQSESHPPGPYILWYVTRVRLGGVLLSYLAFLNAMHWSGYASRQDNQLTGDG